MARLTAIALLCVEGAALLVGLPFLIFLGGWGGADSGGILSGMLLVAGLPAIVYGVCATAAFWLARARRPVLALCAAAMPAVAAGSLWMLPHL